MNNNNSVRSWLPGLATVLIIAPGTVLADGPERAFIETSELRLIYYNPDEYYLVPHATQCFLSALEAQKRLFGWVPENRVNIFLQDYTDSGNASTFVAPRDQINFEVAPSNEPYETFSSAERYGATAVHELTHVATMDGVNPVDARFRRFFHGKVEVRAVHPESLLYNYLTVPRSTAPRWYLEGSAVFTETWMSGGVGRAQGGYDEMVFRAMVNDHARFYDPLGLVSKGTEIDFQTWRQRLSVRHAFHGLPGPHLWPRAPGGLVATGSRQPALLRRRFSTGVRAYRWPSPGAGGSISSTGSRNRTCGRCRSIRSPHTMT